MRRKSAILVLVTTLAAGGRGVFRRRRPVGRRRCERQRRRPDRHHDVARLRQGDRQPGSDTNYEAKSLIDLVDQYNAMDTGRARDARLHRVQRPRAREADRRAARRTAARHHLPVRHVDAADRDRARGHGPHRPRAGPGIQLGRLLRRGARGRDGRRAGVRDPGADRQPRDRLQQGPVRGGRRRCADRRLDVGRLPGRGEGADRPVEAAVRVRVTRSTAARTRSGTTTRCSGKPAATS